MESFDKKFIKKVFILFVLVLIIIVLAILYNSILVDAENHNSEFTIGFRRLHTHYIYKMIRYLEIKDYDKAFDMLTDECKQDSFDNSIEKFKTIINALNSNINVTENGFAAEEQAMDIEEGYIKYFDKVSLGDKIIYVYTFEYAPFNCKIQLDVIDGEGL